MRLIPLSTCIAFFLQIPMASAGLYECTVLGMATAGPDGKARIVPDDVLEDASASNVKYLIDTNTGDVRFSGSGFLARRWTIYSGEHQFVVASPVDSTSPAVLSMNLKVEPVTFRLSDSLVMMTGTCKLS